MPKVFPISVQVIVSFQCLEYILPNSIDIQWLHEICKDLDVRLFKAGLQVPGQKGMFRKNAATPSCSRCRGLQLGGDLPGDSSSDGYDLSISEHRVTQTWCSMSREPMTQPLPGSLIIPVAGIQTKSCLRQKMSHGFGEH